MKTFKLGGVHPAANKLSDKAPIEVAEVPALVAIPMAQNLGAPSKAIVAKGDKVKVGTVIGEPGGFLSSYVHSSVSGTVDKVDIVEDATGRRVQAVFIKVEGDEWEESIDRSKDIVREIKLEKQEIIDKVKAMGIVGMGGATFPTQVKLAPPPTAKPECVIINAVECEPYLTSDHSLMLAHPEEICIGVQILEKAIGVKKAYIGIEANKPDAIQLMTETAKKGFPEIEIVPLKLKYPQGGEKQLINAVIGKEVPSGGLPIATGALVQNVGTAFAVYEAIQKNKPLIERIVTVTGKSIKKPSNFLARLGVPIRQLIDAAGGVPEDTGKIISGGPMMGKAMPDTNSYMVKGCSGILVMSLAARQQVLASSAASAFMLVLWVSSQTSFHATANSACWLRLRKSASTIASSAVLASSLVQPIVRSSTGSVRVSQKSWAFSVLVQPRQRLRQKQHVQQKRLPARLVNLRLNTKSIIQRQRRLMPMSMLTCSSTAVLCLKTRNKIA